MPPAPEKKDPTYEQIQQVIALLDQLHADLQAVLAAETELCTCGQEECQCLRQLVNEVPPERRIPCKHPHDQ